MYLRQTLKKPISIILAILMVLAYSVPQLSYAEEIEYGFQGRCGNTLKLLSYNKEPITISVIEQNSKNCINSIEEKIDGSEDIVFGFTLSAGMNNFDQEFFEKYLMPQITICDGSWDYRGGDVVAKYDKENGPIRFHSYDADTKTIYISVDANSLANGDYTLVFDEIFYSSNGEKYTGVPIGFKFNVIGASDTTALNELINEVEEFVSKATVGTEAGQYPSTDDILQAISDAKKVSENPDTTKLESKKAIDALTKAFNTFKNTQVSSVTGVTITSDKKESVEVAETGTATAKVSVEPDNENYKNVKFSASDNIYINSRTGDWQALYAGDAYIKATSTIDSSKYDIYNFKVVNKNDVYTVVMIEDARLKDVLDKLLESTGRSYEDITNLKIVVSHGTKFIKTDRDFITKNLTNLERLDLSQTGITSLGDMSGNGAFKNNTTLKEVVLPDNLNAIGANAFDGCTSLEKINIPDTIHIIGAWAFKNCTSLKEIKLPEKIQDVTGLTFCINFGTFEGCTSLEEINIPRGTKFIYGRAFKGCSSLKNIEIPMTVETICTETFDGCTSLPTTMKMNILLAPQVSTCSISGSEGCEGSSLGGAFLENVFEGSSVKAVIVPHGSADNYKNKNGWKKLEIIEAEEGSTLNVEVQKPGELKEAVRKAKEEAKLGKNDYFNLKVKCADGVILNNEDIQYMLRDYDMDLVIKLDASEVNLQDDTVKPDHFGGMDSLKEIILPKSTKVISPFAFYDMKFLTSVDMPDTVEKIGMYAFWCCQYLDIDKLPDNLNSIGDSAFLACMNLNIDTIPKNVVEIGQRAFANCKSMPEVLNVNAKVPPTIDKDSFAGTCSVTSICVPEESVQAYKDDALWSQFDILTKKVKVTFNLNNGDEDIVKTTRSGQTLNYMPEAPTKEGYVFGGWYKDVNDVTTAYENNTAYSEDVTYTAKYAHVAMLGAQGKSIVNDKSGIRFGTRIYDDGDEIVEKGTLMLPASLLAEGEALTLDTPKAVKSIANVNYEVNKEKNYVTYLGTLVGISKAQFDSQITATSYVTYKDKAGNKYTVYAPYKNGSTSVNQLLNIK